MQIERHFTDATVSPYSTVKWVRRTAKVADADGRVRFQMDGVEVPESWSQNATDIVASKYFRKAGVPVRISDEPWLEKLPPGDWRADGHYYAENGEVVTGSERSVRQVVHRLAACWMEYGVKHRYLSVDENAGVFYDEIVYMLLHQMAAPNSPQWFNTGLYTVYGIAGKPNGQWRADHATGEVVPCENTYEYPQAMACFIQSLVDDMVNEGGIFDLWTREARVFKFGSGSGTNMSVLRAEGEPLSGGGTSSGLMSWLRIGDRAAGAIKSGGTVRRAALMRVLDLDHPDIVQFIRWKSREELKVKAMVQGLKLLDGADAEYADMADLDLDYSFNGEAYETVSGQNSNNSIRIPSRFFEALDSGGSWTTTYRTTGLPARSHKAEDLWQEIGVAAWRCADPGVQFDDIIQDWHTTPSLGRINASNPCCFVGETLIDTAAGRIRFDRLCEMAERGEDLPHVWAFDLLSDTPVLRRIEKVWKAGETTELVEVLTDKGTRLRCTPEHRFLLRDGSYVQAKDLKEGDHLRQLNNQVKFSRRFMHDTVASVQAVRVGDAVPVYDMQVEGTQNFAVTSEEDTSGHTVVVHNSEYLHIDDSGCNLASLNLVKFQRSDGTIDCEGLVHAARLWTLVLEITVSMAASPSKQIAKNTWRLRNLGLGFANAGAMLMRTGVPYDSEDGRAMVAAAQAIIHGAAMHMSCEITKHLGQAFPAEPECDDEWHRVLMNHYFAATGQPDKYEGLTVPAQALPSRLPDQAGRGLIGEVRRIWDDLMILAASHPPRNAQVTVIAPTGTIGLVMDCDTTGIEPDYALVKFKKLSGGGFMTIVNNSVPTALQRLGYGKSQVEEIVAHLEREMSLKDAPHLMEEHLPVFDCAMPCGKDSRFIAPEAHIRMLAAVQPFVSGGISKTVNCPEDTTVEECLRLYRLGHDLGVKCVALYRDGSKYSQPLNTSSEDKDEDKAVQEVEIGVDGSAPVQRLGRKRLPETRPSVTHRFEVAGHKGYLTTGYYDDGSLGELFVTMSKEGSTLGGLMDTLASVFSTSLQYGVPMQDLVAKMRHQRFEPSGMTGSQEIPFASSLPDYIANWLSKNHPNGIMRGYGGTPAATETEVMEYQQQEDIMYTDPRMVQCPACQTLFAKSSACAPCTNCGHHEGCGA